MASQDHLDDLEKRSSRAPSSSDEASSPSPGVDDFPEGGLQAWTLVLGTAGLTFCTFGYLNAFGVLNDYYATHQLRNESPSNIAWIGSIQAFLQFLGSLAGGPLFDRYGAKVIYLPAFLYVVSFMLTSLCTELYQFILAQGVLGGLCISMIITPGLAATAQYFRRKRAMATGVVVAGSSLGGVIFPIAASQMLANETLGFGWTIRICGFLVLALLIPSCAAIRARLPPRKGQFLLPGAFKEKFYLLVIGATSLLLMSVFEPLFYLPDYATAHGMSARLAPYTIAIFNAASLLGRILPGILADKLGRFNVFFAAAAASGILAFAWQACTTNAAIIVFAVLFGFFSGAIVSMATVCLSVAAPRPGLIGTYIGMGLAASSFAVLVGPPISGAILNASGYGSVADFVGATALAGAGFVAAAKAVSGQGLLSAF